MAPAIINNGSWTPNEESESENDFFGQWNPKVSTRSPAVPDVSRLDMEDYHTAGEEALVSDIIQSLKRSGGCIIRNMLPRKRLAQCEKEIRPYLNATEKADGKHSHPNSMMYHTNDQQTKERTSYLQILEW